MCWFTYLKHVLKTSYNKWGLPNILSVGKLVKNQNTKLKFKTSKKLTKP